MGRKCLSCLPGMLCKSGKWYARPKGTFCFIIPHLVDFILDVPDLLLKPKFRTLISRKI